MSLAVDAGDFGIWIWDLARNEIWASDKWRELFGFAPSEPLAFRRHPATAAPRRSRERSGRLTLWRSRARMAADTRPNTGCCCRMATTRWIASSGRVEFDAHGPAGPDARRLPRGHRAQTGRAGGAAPAAGDRPRRARLDDGPARLGAGARDQPAARARSCGTPRRRRCSCSTHRRTSTRSAPFSPISARTTSEPATSSTGCAACSSASTLETRRLDVRSLVG